MTASWDPVWETVFTTQAWGKYPGEDLIRFVARNFYKAPNRINVELLEVGFGTGANLWFIAREGFTVHGVEGSPSALNMAIERLNREVPDWNGDLCLNGYSHHQTQALKSQMKKLIVRSERNNLVF